MRVIIFDSKDTTFKQQDEIEEVEGSLKNDAEDNLMHSVIENDKEEIDDGKLIAETVNQGISSFTPDIIFRNLADNYQYAERLYGETMIKQLTGYDPNYVRKNINIPEFKNQMNQNIKANIERLKNKGLIDKEGIVTHDAIKLSSYVLYMDELDKLNLKGFGERKDKKKDLYGDKDQIKNYKKEHYRDIAIKDSLKTAIRRQHSMILPEDLRVYERKKKGKINVIYALDSSGSMKGKKIGTAKKAGIALAFKAIQEKNNVGLIVFGSEIKSSIEPCQNFKLILEELAAIKASKETDIASTIKKAVELFPKTKATKHLILLTDAIPTTGQKPIDETIEACAFARDSDVTISVIGIKLDKDGAEIAQKIAEIGQGRLYKVNNLDNMDAIVLEDYYSFS